MKFKPEREAAGGFDSLLLMSVQAQRLAALSLEEICGRFENAALRGEFIER